MKLRIQQLESIIKSTTDEYQNIDATNELALLLFISNPKHAKEMLENVHRKSQNLHYDKGIAYSSVGLGYLNMVSGQYDKAFENVFKSKEIFSKLDDKVGESFACALEGIVYRNLGNFDQALEVLSKNYKMLTTFKDESYIYSFALTNTMGQFGAIQGELGDYKTALEYCESALKHTLKADDYSRAAYIANFTCEIYLKMNLHDKAMDFAEKTLNFANHEEGSQTRSLAYHKMGLCQEQLGNHPKALEYFETSMKLREEIQYKNAIITNLLDIARIHMKDQNLDLAEIYIQKGLQQAIELKVKPKMYQAYELLSQLHEKRGNHQKSLENYKLYIQIKEETLSEKSKSVMKNIQIAHQIETSQKEAEIHRLKNVELVSLNEQITLEKHRSEKLLLNILPQSIAERLKDNPTTIADSFKEATVLFSDLVNFTQLSEKMSAQDLVTLLNEIFTAFDEMTEQYHLEKIKTIGDAYMVVSGIPQENSDHAKMIAQLALQMHKYIRDFNSKRNQSINIRTGIHSGPVVAGIIGKKKFIYDLWGDTVNIASRMESHSIPGHIQVTESTYKLLQNDFHFEERGDIEIKGKGKLKTYFLTSK